MNFKKLTIFILFNFALINNSDSCVCFDSLSIQESISYELNNKYGVLFSGKVVDFKIDSSLYGASTFYPEIYTFELIESWNGIHPKNEFITVYTQFLTSCGSFFEIDSTYLVYGDAYLDGFYLPIVYTDECTRTKRLSQAKEDLLILGKGNKHHRQQDFADKTTETSEIKLFNFLNVFLSLSVLLNLFLIGLFLWHKKQHLSSSN